MWIHFLSVVFPAIAVVVSLTPYLRHIWRLAGKITSGYGTRRSRSHYLKSLIASFSNENADVPDVMNSNRRFDVSLDGTLLPHTTNVNAFILTPAVRVRALKERKYQLPVAIFDVRDVNVLVA